MGLGRDDQKKILKELSESVDGGANKERRGQRKKKGGNVEEKHRLSVQKFSSSSGKGKKFYLFPPLAFSLCRSRLGTLPNDPGFDSLPRDSRDRKKRNSHPPLPTKASPSLIPKNYWLQRISRRGTGMAGRSERVHSPSPLWGKLSACEENRGGMVWSVAYCTAVRWCGGGGGERMYNKAAQKSKV